ncbi:hypothetical protein Tsubulata_036199 [Turnera subulata]|uniref:Bifunctional inhibitor/plant lipid transfer protein/seed storage helical domain-containing protein n=1 Tax=Turnera subulata TaxID=218843 RepID=A0A9Q0G8D5_9ROSI|nr:hypothetical protein Tsubulata_036199 [Turnera subulata]
MELLVPFSRMVPVFAIVSILLMLPVYGQINTPCSPSMLASFTPCMNFLTNSTANGTSPTADCCGALRNLTSNGMDCLCLIVTGSVPFQVPINRSLAIGLPRACNMPGVPVQCKATRAPVPAPGTILSLNYCASAVPGPISVTPPPESDTTPALTPPSTDSTEAPAATTGSRPVLTPPSAAMPSCNLSPSLLLFAVAFVVLKNY